MFEFYNSYDELIMIFSKDWNLVFANASALYHLNCYLDSVMGFGIEKFVSKKNVDFLKDNLTENNKLNTTIDFTLGFSAECEIKFIGKNDTDYILIKTLLNDNNAQNLSMLTAADKIYDPAGIRDYHIKTNMTMMLDCLETLKRQDIFKENLEYLKALNTIYKGIIDTQSYYQSIVDQYINDERSQPIMLRPVNPVALSEKIAEKINNYFQLENVNSSVKVINQDCFKDIISHYDSLAGVITGAVSLIVDVVKEKSEITISFESDDSSVYVIISEKENCCEELFEFLNDPLKLSADSKWRNHNIRAKYRRIIDFVYVNNGTLLYEKSNNNGFSFTFKFNSVTDKLMDEILVYDQDSIIKRTVESFFVNIDI